MTSHDDRRTAPRHMACFPAHLNKEGHSRSALIADLSVRGALLMTRGRLEVGEHVSLNLYLKEDIDQVRVAAGRIVRVEQRSIERSDMWGYDVAVEFDEPLTGCEEEIARLAEHQARLRLPKSRS